MASDVKGTRPYSSPTREARARRTKERIAAAAGRLFSERGYAATTIEAIAAEAGVAVQTVYASFGNKRAILWWLLETTVAGDPEPRALVDRLREDLEECADPAERLGRVVRFVRGVVERSADVHRILRGAASADPELAVTLEEAEARRYRDAEAVVELVVGSHDLPDGVSREEAIDLFFALAGYRFYDDLVVGRGWSGERYERWLTVLLGSALLRR